ANARECHLDAALFADDALVLHALVLAAQALIVLDRAEDARTEQAVTLGLEGAIIDRLRLLDLAVRPRQNLLRRCNRDPDLVKDLSRRLRTKEIHDLLVHRILHHGAALTALAPFRIATLSSRGGASPPRTVDKTLTRPLPRFLHLDRAAAWNCAGRH